MAEILWRIRCDNEIAAERLNDDILSKLSIAACFPALYRESRRIEGAREIVVRPNFFVVYQVMPATIRVIDVVHARRDWPNPPAPSH
ncbi:type II toxin-antitoxin system RelE/ParE family toxin [Roseateles aquatilis]|uniref:type II toxin-antitoxin system RelE/ParE family toxin n=1 Tax=Roseateles aquatilis TaxID=431061 RepID=UPI00130351CB|nr:type II toxin-antitoxin system RelE/ParE family toxin [Roseateles aquatilis]